MGCGCSVLPAGPARDARAGSHGEGQVRGTVARNAGCDRDGRRARVVQGTGFHAFHTFRRELHLLLRLPPDAGGCDAQPAITSPWQGGCLLRVTSGFPALFMLLYGRVQGYEQLKEYFATIL